MKRPLLLLFLLAFIATACLPLDVEAAAKKKTSRKRIAYEGSTFSFTGTKTVRFGTKTNYVTKKVTKSGICNNRFFGADPAPYQIKDCTIKKTKKKKKSGGGGGGGSDNDPTPINGTCGSSHGQSFASAPVSNLCTNGTSSNVSGSGPFTWSCTGTHGGSTANCSANLTPPEAPTLSFSGPGSGIVNVASSSFTIGVATGTLGGTLIATPSDGADTGTFTPSSVSLTTGSPTATFTYTPDTTGTKTISITNNGGLSNPSSLTYTSNPVPATALTLSGPSNGIINVASSNFTVGANGTITGTVTVTPSDGADTGTFSPATVDLTSGSPTATFTYTPDTTGTKTISITNNGGLSNPSSRTYTASNLQSEAPAWLTAPVGQWAQISNTVAPSELGDYSGVGWRDDTTGVEALSALAGGHSGNNSTNRVMSLQFDTDTPTWTQRLASSDFTGYNGDTMAYVPSDGRPGPRHTYVSPLWWAERGVYLFAGRFWGSAGNGGWLKQDGFRPSGASGGDWDPQGTYQSNPAQALYFSVRDPLTGFLYATGNYNTNGYKMDPTTLAVSSWHLPSSNPVITTGGNAFDTRRRFVYHLSSTSWVVSSAGVSSVKIDLASGALTTIGFNASAAWTEFQENSVGFLYNTLVYDENADCYYFYNGANGLLPTEGKKIYKIIPNDTNTWDMTTISITGGVTPAYLANYSGAMNRFYYSKRWNSLLYIVPGQNVYYLKLPFSSALTIRSGATTGTLPYTASVLPLEGEVPAGKTIVSPDDSTMKASIVSTHSDGSAAVVVLTGETSVTANADKLLSLGIAAATADTALTASRISALVSNVTVNFGGTYGSVSMTDFSTPERVWWANSKVICARYRVAAPTPGGTTLEAVIDITAFASPHDRALIEVVMENGTIDALNSSTSVYPADAVYTGATVHLNGTLIATVNSADSLDNTHDRFRAWYASGWVGGNPGLRTTQRVIDLQRHPLFWRMDQKNTADLSGYAADNYTPWGTGRHRAFGMGTGGVDETIGPLPLWDARALQSGDYRMWNAVEQNTLALLTYNINYRDINGLIPDAALMPNKAQLSSRANWPITSAVGNWATFESAHQPAAGLMGFLSRPSPVFIEIAQKVATWSGTADSTNDRLSMFDSASVGLTDLTGFPANGQARSYGWGVRQLAHATLLSPDGSAWKDGGKVWLGRAARFGLAIMNHPKATLNMIWSGAPIAYADHDNNTVPGYQLSTFMHHYATGEFHKVASANLLTNTTEQTYLSSFADWLATGAARWVNELPNGSWRFASYDFSYLGAGASTFNTFEEARANDVSGSGPASPTGPWISPIYQRPATWTEYESVTPTTVASAGYEVYLWYSLVAAVERGVPGAQTAWDTVNAGITNLSTWRAGFGTAPRWGAYPRNQ